MFDLYGDIPEPVIPEVTADGLMKAYYDNPKVDNRGKVQQEVKLQQDKWQIQSNKMEHWANGKLYDSKTDTLYEPQAQGSYKPIHNYILIYNDPFDVVPIVSLGPMIAKDIGLAAAKASKFLSRWGILGKSKIDSLAEEISELIHANPKDIRFTQPNAGPYFSNGTRVDDLLNQLRGGNISAYDQQF